MELATVTIEKTAEAAGLAGWLRVVLGMVLGFLLGRVLNNLLRRASTSPRLREDGFRQMMLRTLGETVTFPLILIAACLGLLRMGGDFSAAIDILITLSATFILYKSILLLDYWIRHATRRTDTTLDDMMVPLVRKSLRIAIIVVAAIHMADLLSDKPVTSLLTGLGVGGLAVALAAQETIKNFFGSLVIFADHPFELGERVVVDGTDGSVEDVGMRSTRIRTLDGHLVTVPNGELANKMIRNISKRPFIKRKTDIALTYDTPPEKVERAIEIIKGFLDAHNEKMHPDFPSRVYFNDFKDCSLNIMVLYWFAPPEYWDFLEFDQMFNLEVLKRFNEEGIEFAFPTQTVHLAGGSLNSAPQPPAG